MKEILDTFYEQIVSNHSDPCIFFLQRDSRVCIKLHCYSTTGRCYAGQPAAEGSPCGQDRICRNGDCVASATSSPEFF
ncbi:hypothetical protein AVEN_217400-1 [Araneus ventricosus]|uniref:ADAMTS cysteine-rich domain-containing protein n=1 Tax=Araneus ventricosus TaxID=182803 RepID=A0A4Y2HYZ4_ARAVE|nr:hypothetical protein AVEN_217400-1 [Araneus ventricosus]